MNEIQKETRRTFPKSVQPGLPKIKPTPVGSKKYIFGQLFEIVQRPVKLEDWKEYNLVTVKRARGGIERRAKLKGSQVAVKSQFYLQESDFLISKRQIVHGACGIVSQEFSGSIVSNEYSVLRCKPELDLEYLRYLTNSVYFQQTCFHSSIGVHIEKMIFKLGDWFEFPINLPSLPEQKKIASFLGAVDAKIAALRVQVSGLETYKRGLMQALFSQTLRFTKPDGTAFPDWEEKMLGDLLTVKYGKDHKDLSVGTIPVLGTGGIMRHVDRALHSGPSILIGRKGTIDKPMFIEKPFWTVDTLFYTDIKEGWVPLFVFAIVQIVNWLKYSEATGVPSLSATAISTVKITVPPFQEEQQKIADALSALDAKIQAVAAQVSHMETFKKGLLKQMFV